jgi:predicted nucleic acid-binding protein
MERRRWKVFLDTSALIAGILSPTGAAHEVLRLWEAGVVQAVVSRQVLVEADRNLSNKVPAVLPEYRLFLRHLSPLVVEDPSLDAVEQAGAVIHRNDAPILAAAIESHVDFLITWNTRDFKRKSVQTYARFPILTPGEFLETFRQSILSED